MSSPVAIDSGVRGGDRPGVDREVLVPPPWRLAAGGRVVADRALDVVLGGDRQVHGERGCVDALLPAARDELPVELAGLVR